MIFELGNKYEESFVISNETYNGFINIFKDKNLLHTNHQFAFKNGFKGIVMHGNILNGFLSYFIGECLPIKDVIIHSQEIQFKNAAYLNDQLKFSAEIIGIYDSVNAIEFKFNFTNKDKEIVAKGKIQIGLLK